MSKVIGDEWKNPASSIPSDWKNSRLAQLTLKISDRDHTTPTYVSPDGGIPIISPTNLNDDMRLDLSKIKYISPAAHEKNRKKTDLLPNDIIFSRIGAGLGKSFLLNKSFYKFSILHSFCQIRANNIVLPEYILWFLRSDFLQWRLKHGIQSIGVPDLGLKEIGELPIFHPTNKAEQRKIADILNAVDDAIDAKQTQIKKLKDLKCGMMQDLLSNGIGNTQFKKSPVGLIPFNWNVSSLKEIIASLEGGVSVNSENRAKRYGEFGILKTSSVYGGIFSPDENKVILENEVPRARINPIADRIIFSRMNTPDLVGESGYVSHTRNDLFLPDRLWLLDVHDKNKTSVLWLSYVLSSTTIRKKIVDAATGTSDTMKNIAKPNLLSIRIGIPPIFEQQKIENILRSIDVRIECSENELAQHNDVKKALMQDLLTGKVRVKVD